MWNSETGKNVSSLKGHQGSIYSIKMTSDGAFAMSVGTDKYIRIWDVRAKSHVAAIDGTETTDLNKLTTVKTLQHNDKVVSVRWHPHMPLLLSTSADKSVRVWYPQTQ